MNISFQLYSARNATPWDQVLRELASLGYTRVEGFGGVYDDPSAFRAMMDENGLSMPSGHFGVDALQDAFDATIETAGVLGIERIYCPYLDADARPKDVGGWVSFAGQLATIGAKVRDAGLSFGWHNHDFEFQPMASVEVPMQIILDHAPDIDWEMDVAWIVRGGAAPLDWIEAHAGRIKSAHVKDIAIAGTCEDEDGWADVGHGTMDWPALASALHQAGCDLFVMEHDNPSDAARFARRSLETAQTF